MKAITADHLRRHGTRINSPVLAMGEKTGHAHVLEAGEGTSFERYSLAGVTYLVVKGDKLSITHEEHGAGAVPEAVYMERIDREFDYSAQAIRDTED